jgi:hypothetical protein
MNKKMTIGAVIILIIFVGLSLYAKNKNDNQPDYRRMDALEEAQKRPDVTINAKHQYKDGQHTFLGSFEVPTPCHSYNAEVKRNEGQLTEIALSYAVSEEVCVQTVDEKQFKVTFEAPEDEDVIATLNGVAVNFNIFEVGEDEDISKVELFIKG